MGLAIQRIAVPQRARLAKSGLRRGSQGIWQLLERSGAAEIPYLMLQVRLMLAVRLLLARFMAAAHTLTSAGADLETRYGGTGARSLPSCSLQTLPLTTGPATCPHKKPRSQSARR